ncbi:MAG: hypothetical protein WCF65_07880, partial [Parachlamydiaceae bacterium]
PPEGYPAYPPHPAYLVILLQSPHTTRHPKVILPILPILPILLFYYRAHTQLAIRRLSCLSSPSCLSCYYIFRRKFPENFPQWYYIRKSCIL